MEVITTILGTALGGIIGYFFSRLQWKKVLKHEESAYKLERKRKLAELSYEIIEYIRDYYCNSKVMNIGEFMACMSGRNPMKKILAIVVTSTPEFSGEIDVLKKHIDQMMGPDYPVSEEKYRAALDAANQFGRNVTSYIKHHY
ncbi:hypothetical protein [Aeromonas caviae]|uniref:Uncharacterized protein n=1 Tax=Aeromonas caviae TaxID=648 RepID=A0AAJ6CQW7_AERCA|nr:hypothetical protein [Aeromonas caviae]WFF98662.1 hypothetical protein P5S46_03405 [Aeromonas caviae]